MKTPRSTMFPIRQLIIAFVCVPVLFCNGFAAESTYRFEGRSTMRRGALPSNRSASTVSRFKAEWGAIKKAARRIHGQSGWKSTCASKPGAMALAFASFEAGTSFVRVVRKEEKQFGQAVIIQLSTGQLAAIDSALAFSPANRLFADHLVNHYESCWQSSPLRHASQPFLDSTAREISKLKPFRKATRLLARNNLTKARLQTDSLLLESPHDPAAKMLSAWIDYRAGRHEKALMGLSFAAEDPAILGLQGYTRAMCHMQKKDFDACHRELMKGTGSSPGFWPNWIALGDLYGRVGACEKAAASYQKVLALDCTDFLSDGLKKRIAACDRSKNTSPF